jgi:hypothetical protein
MRAIAFFDGTHGYLAVYDEVMGATRLITTHAYPGERIRVCDGRSYQQVCERGGKTGRPLEWSRDIKHMGRDFARDCGAKLYKHREGYESAFERMKADADPG